MNEKIQTLQKQLDPKHTKLNEPLSNHTNLKIGGPADIFYEAQDTKSLINVVKLARMLEIPVTIIGRGTNVLIADRGIRGLVIKNFSKTIKIAGEKPIHEDRVDVTPRWESDDTSGTHRGIEFKDLDYDETDQPRIEVVMDSGVDLPYALKYTLDNNITGLQWYAGIPGTIGGAVFNNIHGGTHFISEILSSVRILDKDLKEKELGIDQLSLDYDKSRFHHSDEIILQATFSLFKGDVEKAKHVASEWIKRKKIQPKNSPGCVFTNITQDQKEKYNYPTTSTGYIVEKVLGLKGFCIGDAKIYPKHSNFIVNQGNATAKDYLAVMKKMYHEAKDKLDLELVPEIMLLGFEDSEIEEFRKQKQEELRKQRNREIKEIYK